MECHTVIVAHLARRASVRGDKFGVRPEKLGVSVHTSAKNYGALTGGLSGVGSTVGNRGFASGKKRTGI
jgi:hypothetical protein